MYNYRAVHIEWMDHSSADEQGWKTKEEIEELRPVLMQSLGWVISETTDYITIVGTVSEDTGADDEVMDGDICIMKAAIVKLEEISFA